MAPSNAALDSWLTECVKRALTVVQQEAVRPRPTGPPAQQERMQVVAFDRVLQKIIKEGYDPRT